MCTLSYRNWSQEKIGAVVARGGGIPDPDAPHLATEDVFVLKPYVLNVLIQMRLI